MLKMKALQTPAPQHQYLHKQAEQSRVDKEKYNSKEKYIAIPQEILLETS